MTHSGNTHFGLGLPGIMRFPEVPKKSSQKYLKFLFPVVRELNSSRNECDTASLRKKHKSNGTIAAELQPEAKLRRRFRAHIAIRSFLKTK